MSLLTFSAVVSGLGVHFPLKDQGPLFLLT